MIKEGGQRNFESATLKTQTIRVSGLRRPTVCAEESQSKRGTLVELLEIRHHGSITYSKDGWHRVAQIAGQPDRAEH